MQLALTVAGAAIGFQIGGLQGAAIGASIGSSVGAYYFTEMPDIQGPRLTDLKVQTSTFGISIPIVYGAYRLTGNIIYSTDIIETRKDEEIGGKGGPSATQTTYTYSVYCAAGVCEGPVDGIRRIWANGKLVYNADTGLIDSDIGGLRIYLGGEDQEPDPYWQGVYTDVPAHRGLAYVVFDNLQLATFGNRIPNFSFEVYPAGTAYWLSWYGPEESYNISASSLDSDGTYLYNGGVYEDESVTEALVVKQDLEGNIISKKRYTESYGGISKILVSGDYLYYVINGIEIGKFNPDGTSVWDNYLDWDISGQRGVVSAAAIGDSVVIVGFIGSRQAVIKFDSAGEIIWETYFIIDVLGEPGPTDIQILTDGSIIISSTASYITKLNSSGEVQWIQSFEPIRPSFIRPDSENNFYIFGENAINYIGPATVMKVDSDGNVIWAKDYEIPSTEVDNELEFIFLTRGAGVDSLNNLYVIGDIDKRDGAATDTFLIKFDSSGNLVWSNRLNNTLVENSLYRAGNSIYIGSNYILINGYKTFGAYPKIVSAKLSTDGLGLGTYNDLEYAEMTVNVYNSEYAEYSMAHTLDYPTISLYPWTYELTDLAETPQTLTPIT